MLIEKECFLIEQLHPRLFTGFVRLLFAHILNSEILSCRIKFNTVTLNDISYICFLMAFKNIPIHQ